MSFWCFSPNLCEILKLIRDQILRMQMSLPKYIAVEWAIKVTEMRHPALSLKDDVNWNNSALIA